MRGSQQRALYVLRFRLPLTTRQKFFDARVQKDGGKVRRVQQPDVWLLDEGPATESYYLPRAPAEFLEQFFQSFVLSSTKFGFPRITEDFGYRLLFAPFDPVVEILKRPAQALGERAANRALAGAHESNQDDGVHLRRKAAGHIGPATR